MAKDTTTNDNLTNASVDNRLAAVRDLIFGENMQQYQQHFDEVYDKIDSLKGQADENLADLTSNLENKIEALQKSTEASIEKLTVDIDKKISRLDEAKADRKKLGKALEKIALMLQG